MSITLVSTSAVSSGAGVNSIQITHTPLLSSLLCLFINKTVTGTRTFSTADTTSNSWSQIVANGGTDRESLLHMAVSNGSSSNTITTTVGSGLSTTFRMILLEFSNVSTSTALFDSIKNASGTTHLYGTTGLTNILNDSLTICAGTYSGTVGTITLPSGFTQLSMGVTTVINMYKINTSSISNDTASTSITTARAGINVMANKNGLATSFLPKLKVDHIRGKSLFGKKTYV